MSDETMEDDSVFEEEMSSIIESPTDKDHVNKRPRKNKIKTGVRPKRLRSRNNLNTSGFGGNTSFNANTSVVKATLTANNRALAKALEQKKSELYAAQQTVMHMHAERQTFLEKISILQGNDVDDYIEKEVEKRLQMALSGIKETLAKVAGNLLHSGEMIHDAMGQCNNVCSRKSSAGVSERLSECTSASTTPAQTTASSTHRSIYYRPTGSSGERDSEADDTTEVKTSPPESEESREKVANLPERIPTTLPLDLSIIAEQSYFGDLPFTNEISKKDSLGSPKGSSKRSRSRSGRRNSMHFTPLADSNEVKRNSSLGMNGRRSARSPRPSKRTSKENDTTARGSVETSKTAKQPSKVLPVRRKTRSMSRSSNILQAVQPAADTEPVEQPVPVTTEPANLSEPETTETTPELETDEQAPESPAKEEEQEPTPELSPYKPPVPVSVVVHSPPSRPVTCASDMMDDDDDEATIVYNINDYHKSLQMKQQAMTLTATVIEESLEKCAETESSDKPDESNVTKEKESLDASDNNSSMSAPGSRDPSPNKSGEEKPFFSTFIKLDDDTGPKATFKRPLPLKRKQPVAPSSVKEKFSKLSVKKGSRLPAKTGKPANKHSKLPQEKEIQDEEDKIVAELQNVSEDTEVDKANVDRRGTFCVSKAKSGHEEQSEATEIDAAKTNDRRGTFVIPKAPKTKEDKKNLREKRGTFCVSKNIQPSAEIENLEDIDDDILVADSDDEMDTEPQEEGIDFSEPQNVSSNGENETINDVQDMSMTAIIDFPLSINEPPATDTPEKIPPPSFIKAGNNEPSFFNKPESVVPTKDVREKEDASSDEKESQESETEHVEAQPPRVEEPPKQEEPKSRRTSRQCKDKAMKAIEDCARLNDTTNDSMFIAPPTPDPVNNKTDEIKKNFNAYLSKPGKIHFTAGRKNAAEFLKQQKPKKSRSKARSTLPTLAKPRSKQARSKTRLLSRESLTLDDPNVPVGVFDFQTKRPAPEKDPLRSAFDISLSDSVCAAAKPTLTQYRERQQLRKDQLDGKISEDSSDSEKKKTVKKIPRAKSLDTSQHIQGIMLVAGNGKRTKPRIRSKSVRYATELTDVRITTPDTNRTAGSVSSVFSSELSPTDRVSDSGSTSSSCSEYKDAAGSTPMRRQSAGSTPDTVPESPLVFPDFESHLLNSSEQKTSPESDVGLTKSKHRKRQVIASITSESDDDANAIFEAPKKLKNRQSKSPGKAAKSPAQKIKKGKLKARKIKQTPPSKLHNLKMMLKQRKRAEMAGSSKEQTDSSPEVEKLSRTSMPELVVSSQPTIVVTEHVEPVEVEQNQETVPSSTPVVTTPAETPQIESPPAISEFKEPLPPAKKETKAKGKKRSSAAKLAPVLTDPQSRDSLTSEDTGRKPRRAAAAAVANLKEAKLGSKLRQGDPGSSTIYKGDGSPPTKKRASRGSRKRSALTTIN